MLASNIVISSSGTSQQQAISTGKPVIGMITPDIRPARRVLIKKLNGPLFFEATYPQCVTDHLNHLYYHPPSQETINKGKLHLGKTGALKRISQEILENLT